MRNVVLEGHSRMCNSSKVDGTTALSDCNSKSKWDMTTVKLFVARMIILHEIPLSFVEYVGFYGLVEIPSKQKF